MARDLFAERCPLLLAVAPEWRAYEAWLAEHRAEGKPRDYLFSEQQARFEPRREDVVVALPGLTVRREGGRTRLVCAQPPVDLVLPGVSARDAQRLIDTIDGERCLMEVRWDSGVDAGVLAKLLRAAFGWVLFAPDAVAALEQRISGVEVTRFPGPPYGIERAYWSNMADVREYFCNRDDVTASPRAFEERLREMHVLALMGRGLSSYYKPASPVSDRVVAPGALFLDVPNYRHTARGTLFFDGPRVNVSLLGGAGYHRALYASLDDEEALGDAREFSSGGLSWGGFITARAEHDEAPGPWFCPPRPILEGHWERLAGDLRQADEACRSGDRSGTLRALAHFHQAFARLHPFHCANQSIAMNLVNAVMKRLIGAGMPHLLLDHLALRLSEEAYALVFARAAKAFVVAVPDPAARLATLVERKSRSFAMIESLGSVRDASHVDELLASDPEAAQWALVAER